MNILKDLSSDETDKSLLSELVANHSALLRHALKSEYFQKQKQLVVVVGLLCLGCGCGCGCGCALWGGFWGLFVIYLFFIISVK